MATPNWPRPATISPSPSSSAERAMQARDIGIDGLVCSAEWSSKCAPDRRRRALESVFAPVAARPGPRRYRSQASCAMPGGCGRAGARSIWWWAGRSWRQPIRRPQRLPPCSKFVEQAIVRRISAVGTMAKGYWLAQVDVSDPEATRPMWRRTRRRSANTARAISSVPAGARSSRAASDHDLW